MIAAFLVLSSGSNGRSRGIAAIIEGWLTAVASILSRVFSHRRGSNRLKEFSSVMWD